MAIEYKINATKKVKKLFGTSQTLIDLSFNDFFKESDFDFFISKYSAVSVQDIASGKAAKTRLSQLDGLLVGIRGLSFAGVHIYLENSWYHLRMMQPANTGDWATMLFLLYMLKELTQNPILDENGVVQDFQVIESAVDDQIEYGHQQVLGVDLGEDQTMSLKGILMTVFIDHALLKRHSTPISLSDYLIKLQWGLDAYVAHPTVFIIGSVKQIVSYTLTADLATLLPVTLFIPPRLAQEELTHDDTDFLLNFFNPETRKSLGTFKYSEAIHAILEFASEEQDANHRIFYVPLSHLKTVAESLTPIDVKSLVKNL